MGVSKAQRIEVAERVGVREGGAVPEKVRVAARRILEEIGVESNEVQDRFIGSGARFKFFRAARRVGKSFTAAKDVFAEVLTAKTRGWIVGPSYDLAEREFRYVLDFLMRAHKKVKLPKPVKIRDNPKGGELYIETAWGSEVHGKSADRPMSLVGEENDWVIMSEAAQHKADTWYRYVRPTLSTRNGRGIFASTPDSAGMWLYELELEAVNSPDWEVFVQPAWECPHYSLDEVEAARRELPEDAFYEQYGGEWRFYTGRVYKTFSQDIHVIEPFPIPRGWTVRSGMDFGVRDATAVEFLAESPYGDFYFCDEYYASDRPTEAHIRHVRHIESRYDRVVRVSDHHALGSQLIMDWARQGLPSTPCSNDRKLRRDRMMAALEPHEGRLPWHIRESGGGKEGKYPKLFIFKGKCPNLIRELLFLRWRNSNMREGGYGDTHGDDHAIDAAEYVYEYATRSGRRAGRTWQYRPRYVNAMTGY